MVVSCGFHVERDCWFGFLVIWLVSPWETNMVHIFASLQILHGSQLHWCSATSFSWISAAGGRLVQPIVATPLLAFKLPPSIGAKLHVNGALWVDLDGLTAAGKKWWQVQRSCWTTAQALQPVDRSANWFTNTTLANWKSRWRTDKTLQWSWNKASVSEPSSVSERITEIWLQHKMVPSPTPLTPQLITWIN